MKVKAAEPKKYVTTPEHFPRTPAQRQISRIAPSEGLWTTDPRDLVADGVVPREKLAKKIDKSHEDAEKKKSELATPVRKKKVPLDTEKKKQGKRFFKKHASKRKKKVPVGADDLLGNLGRKTASHENLDFSRLLTQNLDFLSCLLEFSWILVDFGYFLPVFLKKT